MCSQNKRSLFGEHIWHTMTNLNGEGWGGVGQICTRYTNSLPKILPAVLYSIEKKFVLTHSCHDSPDRLVNGSAWESSLARTATGSGKGGEGHGRWPQS